MHTDQEPSVPSRRVFFKQAAGGGVALLGASAATSLLAGCPSDDPNSWLDSNRRDTLNALADTALPNENGDGGREARGLELIFDPYYESNGWIDEMMDEIDYYYGSNFKNGSLSYRTSALNYLTTYNDPWYASDSDGKYRTMFQGAILLTKLAWFGGVITNVGTNYLGFPGPSNRYQPSNGSLPALPSPALGSASGNYYQANPLAIYDNSTTNSWVYVSGGGTVRDFAVTAVIQHTYQGDLTVKLFSPAGTSYTLWNRSGGSSDDLYFVNMKLTTFDNQTAAGWWRLEVADWASGDTGWIHQFAMHITAR